MKVFELQPINGRKSFYNKCRVEEDDKQALLYSYNINIAFYNKEKNEMSIKEGYSKTSSSHIKAFLNYYGFETNPKLYI